MWTKLEKFQVTEFRGNAIYKTQSKGFIWVPFPIPKEYELYVLHEGNVQYVPTVDIRFGDKPSA
jgi:hypothetical protein